MKKRLKITTLSMVVGTLTGGVLMASLSHAGFPGQRGGPDFPISIEDAQTRAAERFNGLDANSNGQIELEEFEAHEPMARPQRRHKGWGGRGHGPRGGEGGPFAQGMDIDVEALKTEIQAETFAMLDSNDDGVLAEDEFAAGNREVHQLARKRVMFKQLDKDDDGVLSEQEMPSRADRLTALDTDSDGFVTRAELHAGMSERFNR